jgi:hypothetical protein
MPASAACICSPRAGSGASLRPRARVRRPATSPWRKSEQHRFSRATPPANVAMPAAGAGHAATGSPAPLASPSRMSAWRLGVERAQNGGRPDSAEAWANSIVTRAGFRRTARSAAALQMKPSTSRRACAAE